MRDSKMSCIHLQSDSFGRVLCTDIYADVPWYERSATLAEVTCDRCLRAYKGVKSHNQKLRDLSTKKTGRHR